MRFLIDNVDDSTVCAAFAARLFCVRMFSEKLKNTWLEQIEKLVL